MGRSWELADDARPKCVIHKEELLTPVEKGFGEYDFNFSTPSS
jgi:hypothetical protein